MNITLIGYRGSGKSSVAGPLAEKLGWETVDADAEIERRAGQSIREIFAEYGEPHFREIERLVLSHLLAGDKRVIAAGGGAVLNAQTRREMQSAGPVVWLKASADTLEARMKTDASTGQRRPDLTRQGGRKEIEQLLAQRDPIYRELATVTVETEGRSVRDIVEDVFTATEPIVHGGNQQ